MASNFWSSSHCNHWLLDPASLRATRALDLTYCTPRQYLSLSIFFSNLLQKLGKRLSLRQIPIATANIFFKRFYLKASFCETDPFLVAAACVYVAAKVEETPVHIKSVVSEARHCFNECGVKTFPSDYTRLAEMEFYLLSDLDFHLIVYHPFRTLVAVCGREPMDQGTFEDPPEAAPAGPDHLEEEMGPFGEAAERGSGRRDDEATRMREMCGRGSGRGVEPVEETVLQMAWFIINDTYRTDIPLLHPPYMIALGALYLAFVIVDTPTRNPANTASGAASRPKTPSTPLTPVIGGARPLSGPGTVGRSRAAELFASFNINMGVLLRIVQEMVAVYSVWEEVNGGMSTAAQAAAIALASGINPALAGRSAGESKPSSGMQTPTHQALTAAMQRAEGKSAPMSRDGSGDVKSNKADVALRETEVVAFLNKMRQARLVDVGHPADGGGADAGGGRPMKRARVG